MELYKGIWGFTFALGQVAHERLDKCEWLVSAQALEQNVEAVAAGLHVVYTELDRIAVVAEHHGECATLAKC